MVVTVRTGRALRLVGAWVVAAVVSVCAYVFVFPSNPTEFWYRVFVFLPHLVLHVIIAAGTYRVFGGGGGDLPPLALTAVGALAGALFLAFAYYQIGVVATNGVWDTNVAVFAATSANDESPQELQPHSGCAPALPLRCCPKRAYFTKPNAQLFGTHL